MEDTEESFIKTSLYISHSLSLYSVLIKTALNKVPFINLLSNFSCFLTLFHDKLQRKIFIFEKSYIIGGLQNEIGIHMMTSHYRSPFITSNKENQQYIPVVSAPRCSWKLCANSANKERHVTWSMAYSSNYTFTPADSLTLCKVDSDNILQWRINDHFTINFEMKVVLYINTQIV
jgi:hypothetical protein